MAVLLRPVDGGSLIKVPTDEVKIIGRGSFLKVTDKRVSRKHANLEFINNELVLTPTHTNPCFLRAVGLGEQARILPRDKGRILKHGEVFGLLPTQLYYKVIYPEQRTPPVSDDDLTDCSENGDNKIDLKKNNPFIASNGKKDSPAKLKQDSPKKCDQVEKTKQKPVKKVPAKKDDVKKEDNKLDDTKKEEEKKTTTKKDAAKKRPDVDDVEEKENIKKQVTKKNAAKKSTAAKPVESEDEEEFKDCEEQLGDPEEEDEEEQDDQNDDDYEDEEDSSASHKKPSSPKKTPKKRVGSGRPKGSTNKMKELKNSEDFFNIIRSRPKRVAAQDAIVKTIGDIYNEEFSDYEDLSDYCAVRSSSSAKKPSGRRPGRPSLKSSQHNTPTNNQSDEKHKSRGRPKGSVKRTAEKRKQRDENSDEESESEISRNKKFGDSKARNSKVVDYADENSMDCDDHHNNAHEASDAYSQHDYSSNLSDNSDYVKPKRKKSRGRPKKVSKQNNGNEEFDDPYVPIPSKSRASNGGDTPKKTKEKAMNSSNVSNEETTLEKQNTPVVKKVKKRKSTPVKKTNHKKESEVDDSDSE